MLDDLLRASGRRCRHQVLEVAVVLGALEGEDLGAGDVVLVAGDLVGGQAQGRGDLGVGGDAAEGGGELGAGLVEVAGAAAYRAGGPVDAAQLVEDGAADAGGGVAGEGDAAVGVEPALRLDQGHHAGGGQVVAVHVGGDPAHGLAHDVADQRQVLADQLVG